MFVEPHCLDQSLKSKSSMFEAWAKTCSTEKVFAFQNETKNEKATTSIKHGSFMKTVTRIFKFTFLSACLLIGVRGLAANEIPEVRDVVIGVGDAFVPGGFDSHSDSYVVVTGIFPNGCYKWKGAEVKHLDALKHEIRSLASVNQGMCTMALIPFTQEVRLGELQSGTHQLRFMSGDGTFLQKTMVIE
jgi:hypothetical protein